MASGRGSDFQSLIDAVEAGELDAELALLVCNSEDALAIERAKKHGVPWVYIDHRGKEREAFDREVAAVLKENEIDLIVLAGFMRILSPWFVREFKHRIINIHPSLLPSFPGAHGHRDALEWGVKVSGCTIHFVDEETDHGPIIIQKAVEVREDDTEDALSERILEWEHRLLPKAVQLYAEGRLQIEGRRVRVKGPEGASE